MNYKDIQPIDSRPKRRKSRDNPYTLFTVGMWEGSPRYYISFRTTNGDSICLEIAQEVYKEMDQFELDDLRYLNEVDNHYEHSALTEETLSKRTAYRPEGIDVYILNKMQNECLKEYIAMLPPTQRRRLILYYYGKFTCKQIAKQDNCSVIAVKKSLESARKNLKKLIEGVIPSAF